MGFTHIEEDFRYATAIQVAHYTADERLEKPHLPGYDLTQLLDQLVGHWRSQANRDCVFYLQAPPGTAYWLIRSWDRLQVPPRALLQLEPPDPISPRVQSYLTRQTAVTEQETELLRATTCTVLACRQNLRARYDAVRSRAWLSQRPLIAYDPDRLLAQEPGDYFMNSAIWVKSHGD